MPEEIAEAVTTKNLAVAAVLSGNRNYEGRIHGQVKASSLASCRRWCVAYALIGTVYDISVDALGTDQQGNLPVYLKDIWLTAEEIETLVAAVSSEQFNLEYGRIFEGDDKWKSMPLPTGTLFDWTERNSTYVS